MSQPDGFAEFEIEPLPENLLREPLDFLFADHYRQRVLCDLLRRIVAGPDEPPARAPEWAPERAAGQALAFLERDLPLHHEDEELDLFPCLRLQCRPEDNIGEILRILSAEHVSDEAAAAEIVGHLRRIAGEHRGPRADLAGPVGLFVAMQQRHLIWENVVVLPLARRRLSAADRAAMGRAMAARRNVPFPL